jgi:hypothetical protein
MMMRNSAMDLELKLCEAFDKRMAVAMKGRGNIMDVVTPLGKKLGDCTKADLQRLELQSRRLELYCRERRLELEEHLRRMKSDDEETTP